MTIRWTHHSMKMNDNEDMLHYLPASITLCAEILKSAIAFVYLHVLVNAHTPTKRLAAQLFETGRHFGNAFWLFW